ncbi:Glycosyltransferase involved in cell wall bisynthesis [Actinokineospora alba]|uniref:Glycosyltransferase involved in cell wall bisynthesis n=1 Tax=Actinokineospora alba TaxID=504798 RepID=A0A1H0TC92_9PSEU|nr:glycosyltransferase family 2 protein [Actinokineospora alba]TDP66273.1 glycosyltransferase involved in cell wall biosynthesis [Actinokineospora alba]SDJ20659.1 Glycosyltransferase involved in cell wall bisynthesis [Actinokineospora alba]SDP51126.1 Glycosyltransferase involved in cell wall bisynthesis [Actinokineospora alba]
MTMSKSATDAQAVPTVLELSIVLPCLNEAETLETCVRKARESLRSLGVAGEVIVADNGSTDGSQDIARANGARVVDVPRRGYGAALAAGIEAAGGEYVLMADADDSYALDDIGGFLEALRGGADLVMGNRFQGGIAEGAMPFLHRYLGNPVLSRLGRLFFRIPVGDFHCGIRAFRRDRILELGLRTSGMEFASEMVVRASLNHFKIREVPTTLRPDGRTRAPHLRTWRDGWRHLRFLLAFSPRWLLYYPSIALQGIGLIGMLWLSFGPQRLAGVGFGLHTMLACATMFVLGLQGMSLAVVARSYAAHLGLLPPPSGRMILRIAKASLERGLWIGLLLLAGGITCFIVALSIWGAAGFGELDVVQTMRVPILGMVLMVAGFQLITVSFTLSLTKIGED